MEKRNPEKTPLLYDNPGPSSSVTNYGSDAIEDSGTYENAAFRANLSDVDEEENIFGDLEADPPQSNSERCSSADEILHLMHFAFVNKGFNAAKEIAKTQDRKHGEDKITFKERILDGIKESTLPMKEKLKVHSILTSNSGLNRHQRISQKYIKTKSRRDIGISFTLWEGAITSLAAYFGSNVASYFTFLRTLFLLNLVTGITYLSFTTVPQIISGDYELTVPSTLNATDSGHFGYLSESLLFYGAYQDGACSMESKLHHYSLPKAYLMTWVVISLLTLLVIVIIMHVRYRKSKHTEQGDDYPFTWSMFCLWDHSIYTRSGVKNRLKSFSTELKEKIREENSFKIISVLRRILVYCLRVVTNIFVLGILGGSAYLIYYVEEIEYDFPDVVPDFLDDAFGKYKLAVVVSVLKLMVPVLFQWLTMIEGWHPRTEQKINIARTTFFYYASLFVFMLSLIDLAECTGQTENCLDRNQTSSNVNDNATQFCCWENEVGEEVFKVILVDLGLCILTGLLMHVLRAVLVRYEACVCCTKIGFSEFAVTSNLLDLVYGQGLVWLGLYFSPLLAMVAVIKLFIVFYFRYFVAKFANVPPKKMFKASRSGTFYLFLLLMTWFLCIVPVGYFLSELTPSWHCGPFQSEKRVYDVMGIDLGTTFTGDFAWVNDVIRYMGTAIVVIPLIIVLLLVILYFYTRASSYSSLVKELRTLLIFERRVERKKVFAKALSAPGQYCNVTIEELEGLHEKLASNDVNVRQKTEEKVEDRRKSFVTVV